MSTTVLYVLLLAIPLSNAVFPWAGLLSNAADVKCHGRWFPKQGQEFRIFSNHTRKMLIKTDDVYPNHALRVGSADQMYNNNKHDDSWFTLETSSELGKYYINTAFTDLRMFYSSGRIELAFTSTDHYGYPDQLFAIIPSLYDNTFRIVGEDNCKIYLRDHALPHAGADCSEEVYADQFFYVFIR